MRASISVCLGATVALLAACGCVGVNEYRTGDFARVHPAAAVRRLGAVELAFSLHSGRLADNLEALVLRVDIGNDGSATPELDFGRLVVRVTNAKGEVRDAFAYDPRHEIRALHVDRDRHGWESFALALRRDAPFVGVGWPARVEVAIDDVASPVFFDLRGDEYVAVWP